MTTVYRHKALPSLGGSAQREVVDEFRKIERWGLNVNYKLKPFTVDNSLDPSRVTLDANLTLPFDRVIGFLNSTNSEPIGGIGNVQEVPDVLLFVGTAELTEWEDESTRRPVAFGGSSVTIDAGQHMELRLPGVDYNETGHTLQLLPDGVTVVAVPNPPADWADEDTSDDDGTVLNSGLPDTWARFPDGAGAQPEGLVINVPSGTQAGLFYCSAKVRVLNTSGRTGTLSLGMGLGSAEPLDENATTYVIPANFSGSLELSALHNMTADLTNNMFLRIWFKWTEDHGQFNLVTDTANGQHTFNARINY